MANLRSHQNILLNKVATKSEYIGYYLLKYIDIESISKEELLSRLSCDENDFIRLSLCRTSLPPSSQFVLSMNKVSNYANVDQLALTDIVKQVLIRERLGGTANEQINQSYLFAAREKNRQDNNRRKKKPE